mgnify:CR=1 FL=1
MRDGHRQAPTARTSTRSSTGCSSTSGRHRDVRGRRLRPVRHPGAGVLEEGLLPERARDGGSAGRRPRRGSRRRGPARRSNARPAGSRPSRTTCRHICASLGPEPADGALAEALDLRLDSYRTWFFPRRGALETLTELKGRGYPIALISMCAPDAPAMWRTSALAPFVDVEVFSSETGLRKPDAGDLPACDRRARRGRSAGCVYCGDGAYGELAGRAGGGDDVVPDRGSRRRRGGVADARARGVGRGERRRSPASSWRSCRVPARPRSGPDRSPGAGTGGGGPGTRTVPATRAGASTRPGGTRASRAPRRPPTRPPACRVAVSPASTKPRPPGVMGIMPSTAAATYASRTSAGLGSRPRPSARRAARR